MSNLVSTGLSHTGFLPIPHLLPPGHPGWGSQGCSGSAPGAFSAVRDLSARSVTFSRPEAFQEVPERFRRSERDQLGQPQ